MSVVNVDCENLENNPKCAHGPTLKFSRVVKRKAKNFFACSAYRDRKECPFFLLEGDRMTESKKVSLEEWKQKTFPTIDHEIIIKRLQQFKVITAKKHFCLSCFNFVFPEEFNDHKNHLLKPILKNIQLEQPRNIIFPLTKNKGEAQFWFSDKTLNFILTNIKRLNPKKVLCIGAPTIHEHLVNSCYKSLLLDIDHRYHWFYDSDKYIWFNMFNFHFMGDKEKCAPILMNYLKDGPILAIIDPPFGARTEPLSRTVKTFEEYAHQGLKVLLILPYFMEPQVLSSFSNFVMLDFPVEYTNHKKFKDKQSTKSSPVRIFTNISPGDFIFPPNEGYYFCKICKAWRSKLNKHCIICNTCPSKNGASYKHCFNCGTCVKLTWTHCNACSKCTLPEHNCKRSENVVPNKKKKIKH